MFDDHHDLFGITENEGWSVRGYLSGINSLITYDPVEELYALYPTVMEGETREFIEKREKIKIDTKSGLPPFSGRIID